MTGERIEQFCARLPSAHRAALERFVRTGDAEAEFLAYVEESSDCQELLEEIAADLFSELEPLAGEHGPAERGGTAAPSGGPDVPGLSDAFIDQALTRVRPEERAELRRFLETGDGSEAFLRLLAVQPRLASIVADAYQRWSNRTRAIGSRPGRPRRGHVEKSCDRHGGASSPLPRSRPPWSACRWRGPCG